MPDPSPYVQQTLPDFSVPHHALPNRQYEWSDTTTVYDGGARVVRPEPNTDGDLVSLQSGQLHTSRTGYVLDGIGSYIEQYRDRELSLPDYYSQFDEFDTYIGQVSVVGTRYGLGITESHLETALRFATGGGHYNEDEISVIACGAHPFVIRTSEGDFLFHTIEVDEQPANHTTSKSVSGLEIHEDDQTIIDGVQRFIDDIGHFYSRTITGYSHPEPGSHVFKDADGNTITVNGHVLAQYSSFNRPVGSVLGEREQTDDDTTYTVTWDELEYQYGSWDENRVCVGVSFHWGEPGTPQTRTVTGRLKATARYYFLMESQDGGSYTLSTTDTVLWSDNVATENSSEDSLFT